MIDQFFNAFTISSLFTGHSGNKRSLNLPPPMAGFGGSAGGEGHQGQAPGGYQFGQGHAGVQHQGQAIAGNQWPYILIL